MTNEIEVLVNQDDEMASVLQQIGERSQGEIRAFIHQAEEKMKDGTPIDIPLKHMFSRNLYAREITIPKTVLISGKIHKFECMSTISKGDVSVLSVDGYQRIKAGEPGSTFVSSPGVKRLIYSHEESVWTTYHGTAETNIEKLEKELVTEDYSEVLGKEEKKEITSMEVKLCHS